MKKFIVLPGVFASFPIVSSAPSSLADAARRERAKHSSITFAGGGTPTAVPTSSEDSSVPAPVVKPVVMTRTDIDNKANTRGPEIPDAQHQPEDARNQLDEAKQTDLEDELHRAGGPAGWAR